MPAHIIANSLDFAKQTETFVVMDDYGASITKVLDIAHTGRAEAIANTQAAVSARQALMEAYATSIGVTHPPVLTLSQKQALYQSRGGQVALTAVPAK